MSAIINALAKNIKYHKLSRKEYTERKKNVTKIGIDTRTVSKFNKTDCLLNITGHFQDNGFKSLMIQPTVSSVYIANSKNQEWSVEKQCEEQKVYGI